MQCDTSHLNVMATFEGLPNEIVETIVGYLDLQSIGHLRQTSRTLAAKATQDRFKSFFKSKHVEITRPSLEAFVRATRPGHLGCLLQNLTLVGIVNNTIMLAKLAAKAKEIKDQRDEEDEDDEEDDKTNKGEKDDEESAESIARELAILVERQQDFDDMHEAGTDVDLLREAFNNFQASGKSEISSVSLAIEIYREDPETRVQPGDFKAGSWKMIWQCAAETYRTALLSFGASGLHINDLNVYERIQRCSLAGNKIYTLDFTEAGLADVLGSLRSLSMSLSDKIIELSTTDIGDTGDPSDSVDWEAAEDTRPVEDVQDEVDRQSNYEGLAILLQQCPRLESLTLHHFQLDTQPMMPEINFHRYIYMDHIAERAHVPHLKALSLRGILVNAKALLSFVKQAPAMGAISLQHVSLRQGTFREFFDYCTSDGTQLERLCFDDLRDFGLVDFEEPGVPRSDPMFIPCGNTLERSGAGVRKPIRYRYPEEGHPIGNPFGATWRSDIRKEYGPVQ